MWTTNNDFWGLKIQTTLISVSLPWWVVFLGVDPLTDSPVDLITPLVFSETEEGYRVMFLSCQS